MGRNQIVATALVLLLLCRVAPGQEELVHNASDLGALRVEGAEVISADAVRVALRSDWMVQLHATPTAPLRQLVRTIEHRLRRAYQSDGFPEATVQIIAEADQPLLIRVNEGLRYFNGDIRVTGVPDDLAALIKDQLTQPRRSPPFESNRNPDTSALIITSTPGARKAHSPQWPPGKPTRFDDVMPSQHVQEVKDLLAQHGYLQPVVDARADVDGEQGVLVIYVKDLGPRSHIAEISIDGLVRSEREQLLALLDVKVGDAVDTDALYVAQRRLWDSGRFITHTLALRPAAADPSRATLFVWLKESEHVPPLGEELSEAEQAMLRFSEWLTSFEQLGTDLMFEGSIAGFGFEIIISPAGAWIRISRGDGDRGVSEGFALLPNELRYLAGGEPHTIGIRMDDIAAFAPHLRLLPDPERNGGRIFQAAAGLTTSRVSDSPIQPEIVLCPVMLLDLLYRNVEGQHPVVETAGGRTRVHVPHFIDLSVETETGRLIGLDFTIEDEDDDSFMRAATGENLLQARLDAMPPLAENVRPVDVVAALLSSTLIMLPIDPEGYPQIRSMVAHAAGSVLSLVPIPEGGGTDGEDSFSIPIHPDEIFTGELSGVLQLAVPFVDELFAHGDWPWTVARQTLLAMAGSTQYAQSELVRLHESEMGPIGYATVAWLLSRVDPRMGQVMAREGMARLDTDAFLRDCRVLLDAETGLGRGARELLRQFAALDEAQLAALASVVPAQRESLHNLAAALRGGDDAALDERLDALLRREWDRSWREQLRAYLKRLADPALDGRL